MQKDPLTMPATLKCKFHLSENPVLDGKIIIRHAEINLAEIDISGNRQNADNVILSRIFTGEEGHFSLESDSSGQIITVDIPQGIYNRLAFNLKFAENPVQPEFKNNDNVQEDSNPVEGNDKKVPNDEHPKNFSDYMNKTRPGIFIKGQYMTSKNDTWNIIIAIDNVLVINTVAKQGNNKSVVLRKDHTHHSQIIVDPAYWFELTDEGMLEDADIFIWEGKKTLFIHKDYNKKLFNILANRIQESTGFMIDE